MPPLVISSQKDLDAIRNAQHAETLLDAALDESTRAQRAEEAALDRLGTVSLQLDDRERKLVFWRAVAIVGVGCAAVLAAAVIWMEIR